MTYLEQEPPLPVSRPNLYGQTREFGERVEERIWGVQVVILDQDNRVFLRRDPDGHKLEGHFGDGGVFFPNSRPLRFNSVSGGASMNEAPSDAARREMQEELGQVFVGNGRFYYHSDVPVFACYQEGKDAGRLLGGLLVTYHASLQETSALQEQGRFWDLDSLYRRVKPGSGSDMFRPAFRTAIWVLHGKVNNHDLGSLIESANRSLIKAAIARTSQKDLKLDLGYFESNTRAVQSPLL